MCARAGCRGRTRQDRSRSAFPAATTHSYSRSSPPRQANEPQTHREAPRSSRIGNSFSSKDSGSHHQTAFSTVNQRITRREAGNWGQVPISPQDICTFRDQQIGGRQGILSQSQCTLRPVFINDPFDGHTGVDDIGAHRSSRPSRRRTSAGVCFLPATMARNSAARSSKDGSASLARA